MFKSADDGRTGRFEVAFGREFRIRIRRTPSSVRILRSRRAEKKLVRHQKRTNGDELGKGTETARSATVRAGYAYGFAIKAERCDPEESRL